MNSGKNLKSVVIADSIPGGNKLSTSIIVVFLAIYLAILKLIERGIILNISLVAFLGLVSIRKWSLWILQPLSDIYTFPSSKNFLTTPFSKPLIPCSFVFSRPIISRLFSDRGGQKLGARGMSPWSSNIKILLCSPIYTLTRRTWGWG
jgi:hypothetical protein